ncbi:MAG TPA: hypothetical protein VF139_14090, partial [Candidatus Polarisedimenticolaceae bacterium]
MLQRPTFILAAASLLLPLLPAPAHARDVGIEERVAGQLALDDLYRSWQTGSPAKLEDDDRRAIAERKVARAVALAAALERERGVRIDADLADRELR